MRRLTILILLMLPIVGGTPAFSEAPPEDKVSGLTLPRNISAADRQTQVALRDSPSQQFQMREGERKRALELEDKADREAASDPVKRRQLIVRLVADLDDAALIATDRPKVVKSFLRLGNIKAIEVTSKLVENINFETYAGGMWPVRRDALPSFMEMFPALAALKSLGQPSASEIIETAALQDRSRAFQGSIIYILREILNDPNGKSTRAFLAQHATGRQFREQRLQALIGQVSKMEHVPGANATENSAINLTKDQKFRLDELVLLLRNVPGAQQDPVQILAAIRELSRSPIVEAAPALAGKLDFSLKAPVPDQLPLDGGEYPAIDALVRIGKPAVPALMLALTTPQRSQIFIDNGLKALIEITGGDAAATEVLTQEIANEKRRGQRIHDLIKDVYVVGRDG